LWFIVMLNGRFSYWTVSHLFSRWSKSRLNFKIYRPIVFYLRRNTNRKWHRSFTNAADCKYEFIHIELVQVLYDIKLISSGAFEFEKKKQQTIPKNRSRYAKKCWCVKCNKTITALHFVQYDVLWSWSILLFSAP